MNIKELVSVTIPKVLTIEATTAFFVYTETEEPVPESTVAKARVHGQSQILLPGSYSNRPYTNKYTECYSWPGHCN